MAIITLTTDLGLRDYYVALIKGAILGETNVVTVDITHEINPFDIYQAAYAVKRAYTSFPLGTIHVVGVTVDTPSKNPYIVAFYKGHYFVGADNGLFSLLFDEKPEQLFLLKEEFTTLSFTFPVLTFVKAALHLATSKPMAEIATPLESLTERNVIKPYVTENSIRGYVLYIDAFENALTDIHKDIFYDLAKGRSFVISFRAYDSDVISKNYHDAPEGELLTLFNSSGFLEIAINKGKASSLLYLNTGDPVMVNFL